MKKTVKKMVIKISKIFIKNKFIFGFLGILIYIILFLRSYNQLIYS